MKEIEKIPFSFQKSYSCKCNCCETIKTEVITYELNLKFISSYDDKNKETRTYLLFYKPKYYQSFSVNPPIIGYDTGMGKRNIRELVDPLTALIH